MIESKRDITRIKRALSRLLRESGRILEQFGNKPTYGSKAYSEYQVFPRSKSLDTALRLSDSLLESAADHLFAFLKTVTEPSTAMAPWTCIRATLETTSLAAWLLDPEISSQARVQRSFAYRYWGLIEQIKVAKSMNNEIAVIKIEQRIDEVESLAIQLGFPRLLGKNNKRKGIGQCMPSITEIIREVMNKESFYRILSAMAHGHNWATLRLSFKDTNIPLAFEKHLNPTMLAYLTYEGAMSFIIPVWYKFELFGWDKGNLSKLYDSIFNSIRVKENNLRFWRQ